MTKLLNPDDLTPEERAKLVEEYKWDGVSPIPEDMQARMNSLPTQVFKPSPTVASSVSAATKEAVTGEVPGLKEYLASVTEKGGVVNNNALPEVLPVRPEALNETQKMFQRVVKEAAQNMQEAQDDTPDVLKQAQKLNLTDKDDKAEPKETKEEQKAKYIAALREMCTKEEREEYAECVVTGTAYRSTHKLLGGRLVVTFREPLASDVILIAKQVSADILKNRHGLDPFVINEMRATYNIACSLFSVVDTKLNKVLYELGEGVSVGECYADVMSNEVVRNRFGLQDGDSAVYAVYSYLISEALSGSIWNLIRIAHREFQQKLDALRDLAFEPDFF